ncbi:membrane protein, partial [Tolypocladium ophioglossoides CBS 100239]
RRRRRRRPHDVVPRLCRDVPLCRPEKADSNVGLSVFFRHTDTSQRDRQKRSRTASCICLRGLPACAVSRSATIMAPAVEQPARASSPSRPSLDILPLASTSFDDPTTSQPVAQPQPQPQDHGAGALDWQSLADLPAFEVPSFNTEFQLDTSGFSGGKKLQPAQRPEPEPAPQPRLPRPQEEALNKLLRKPPVARSRTASLINRPRTWLSSGSKPTKEAANDGRQSRPHSSQAADHGFVTATLDPPQSRPSERGMPPSASFANFARWSWAATSRSPSPKNVREPPANKPPSRAATMRHTKAPPDRLQLITDMDLGQTEKNQTPDSPKPASKTFARSSSYFAKMKQKPPASMTRILDGGPESDNSCASSSTSLGNRASNSEKTSASQSTCSDGNTNTPITDESSNEMIPHMRDSLWSSFKTLEVELKGFGFKQTAQRVSQVKNLVLPFLRSTMDHKSTKSLGLEDVDRRATVLNKWWVAILEMLEDQAQHPVPGVDRPILLEAATLLMMRPEWRQATTYFQAVADRSPSERVRSRSRTNSSDSSQSALLAESAEHSVRTMFVTNLVKQMGYVVDKMSMRHAPLSLVNFSGKTCAYAFFFAPGVADILVRLWGLTPELIRRAANEFGLPRKDTGESDDITALFPPKLGHFGWTSAKQVWDMLKRIPKMSLLVARISWTGPWVSRWKGRDTDLFFIFCKYFHVLSDQFMPSGLPLTEKARSPAFVLVHAQLLSILDTTIHRQTAIEHAYGPPLIDSVNGVDASALAMPLPPTNLMKGMAENRLVILLRDVLADGAAEMACARHTFAESFAAVMKGATCKTSQFNSAACFTLCDFLEEAIMIFHEFGSRNMSTQYIDWTFWLEVCKRIMNSLNTMSEVRMLSFIHTIWDAVAKDPRRKAALCLDWLLAEETFTTYFNNWCPMVRAYYQRLLCWRICRDDGNANEVDLNIMFVAAARLKTVWSHYLYLKRTAEEAGRATPSTVPMCPALGKKFMIIRQEVNTPQPGLFMGFDTFARTSSSDGSSWNGFPETSLSGKGDSKKRWSLLGKVLSMTTGSSAGQSAASDGFARNPLTDSEPFSARREATDMSARPVAPLAMSNATRSNGRTGTAESDSLSSSPVFDEQKYTFKFILGWLQHPAPTLGRDLTRPRLPAPAQSQVALKARNGRAASPSPTLELSLGPGREVRQNGLGQRDRRSSVNASVEEWLRGTPMAAAGLDNENWNTSSSGANDRRHSSASEMSYASTEAQASQLQETYEATREPLTKAVKPVGIYAKSCVYSGRALAEWGQVVSECNSFIDRRREEGVGRLGEMEVPQLGVEGFRKAGG